MNRALISIAATALMLAGSSAREIAVVSGGGRIGAEVTAEHHAGQSAIVNRELGVPCTTRYFLMTRRDGSRVARKSVDCEE